MTLRAMTGGVLALLSSVSALASETQTYIYDAQGRLIQIVRSGSVNNGVIMTYALDDADNRVTKTVSGSANPPVTP